MCKGLGQASSQCSTVGASWEQWVRGVGRSGSHKTLSAVIRIWDVTRTAVRSLGIVMTRRVTWSNYVLKFFKYFSVIHAHSSESVISVRLVMKINNPLLQLPSFSIPKGTLFSPLSADSLDIYLSLNNMQILSWCFSLRPDLLIIYMEGEDFSLSPPPAPLPI